jgi:DNA polymerase I
MKAQPQLLVIDGNNIARVNHNTTKLHSGGMETQAVFGFLRSLRTTMESFPENGRVVVLWDGRAQWRYDIFPEYKANRVKTDPKDIADNEAFLKQVPLIKALLNTLGITQIHAPNREADDIAGYLVPKAAMQGVKVKMITGDEDWLQLVHPNVTWFAPVTKRMVGHTEFFEATGFYTPRSFVEGKALQGDGSDNIAGIPDMGPKTSAVFLAKWKTVQAFFDAVDAGTYTPATRKSKTAKKPHPEELLAAPEGRATFVRNMKLIDMMQVPACAPGDIVTTPGKVDVEKFRTLCSRLGFASILRDEAMFLRAMNITPTTTNAATVPPWENQ